MVEMTTGGVHVFNTSVGLDVGTHDVDLNEIRGRAVVAIICADCGHAPIGRVLKGRHGLAWMNYYAAPHTGDYPERRRESDGGRIPAPRVVMTHRLQGQGYPLPAVWCEKHGRREVPPSNLAAAMAREAERKKVVRLPV